MGGMKSGRRWWNRSYVSIGISLVMAGSLWFYVQRILIPHQKTEAAATGQPRGILSDLYPRWLGARELLLRGRDPYSDEVTRQIQTGYYGRPLDPKRPSDPKDQERFAYPVYVVFLLAPTVHAPFFLVRAAFFWLLLILTGASVFLWLRAFRWSPPSPLLCILVILTMSSFGVVQGSKLQQLSLLVGFLVAAAVLCVTREQFFLGGLLFSVATIKPQLVVLVIAGLFLWTLGHWRQRQGYVWGLATGVLVLVTGGEWLLPGWMGEFLRGLVAYEHYTGGRSLLDALVGRTAGTILAVIILAGAAVGCWGSRRIGSNTHGFQLEIAFLLTATILVVPITAPYNHVLLLPAVLLILQSWPQLWQRRGLERFFCALGALILFWQWAASFALMIGAAFVHPLTIQKTWAVPLWAMLGVPPAILALLSIVAFRNRSARGAVIAAG